MDQNPHLDCWSSEVRCILKRNDLYTIFTPYPFQQKVQLQILYDSLLKKDFISNMKDCQKSKSLRTYNSLFNLYTNPEISMSYSKIPMSFIFRKIIAKIRLGVLNIRIVTGRYENDKLDAKLRICKQCNVQNSMLTFSDSENDLYIENERHVVLYCKQHDKLRQTLYQNAEILYPGFLHIDNKFEILMTCSSLAKPFSRYLLSMMNNRIT